MPDLRIEERLGKVGAHRRGGQRVRGVASAEKQKAGGEQNAGEDAEAAQKRAMSPLPKALQNKRGAQPMHGKIGQNEPPSQDAQPSAACVPAAAHRRKNHRGEEQPELRREQLIADERGPGKGRREKPGDFGFAELQRGARAGQNPGQKEHGAEQQDGGKLDGKKVAVRAAAGPDRPGERGRPGADRN